jgi:hypothetical protein
MATFNKRWSAIQCLDGDWNSTPATLLTKMKWFQTRVNRAILFLHTTDKERGPGLIGQDAFDQHSDGKRSRVACPHEDESSGARWLGTDARMIGKVHRTLPTSILRQVRSSPLSGDRDWQTVSVRTVIPDSTTLIGISATLLDAGTGCIDDVRVRLIQ